MPQFEIQGAEQVDALVRRIRVHADAKALRKELYQGLNRVTKGVRADMRASIGPSLPSRGGLAALLLAKASLTSTASDGRDAGADRKSGVLGKRGSVREGLGGGRNL